MLVAFGEAGIQAVSSNYDLGRTFLRGTGVALALPFLESLLPASQNAQRPSVPRRMVAIETNMGILPQFFFPTGAGRDYELSPYLNILSRLRDKFTVFSGVSAS